MDLAHGYNNITNWYTNHGVLDYPPQVLSKTHIPLLQPQRRALLQVHSHLDVYDDVE